MKILFVSATFPPKAYGGITSVSYNLARALARRGHSITVFTTEFLDRSSRKSNAQRVEALPGMEIQYFRNASNRLAEYRLFLPVRLGAALEKNIRQYDVVHLHDFRSVLGVAVHHYATKYRVPYVMQAHGTAMTLFQKAVAKRVFDKLWGRNILMDAARLVATTPSEMAQYQEMGARADAVVLIPNGIDVSEFVDIPPRGRFRQRIGVPDDWRLVLFVGRIHHTKGVDILVEAFRDLALTMENVALAIVGPDDGDLRTVLRLARRLNISERLFYVDGLYGREKLEAYVDADLFVLPARYEIFGIVVFEALACGTPIIVTDGCGTAAMIRDADIGCVAKAGDVSELATQLRHALSLPIESRDRAARGRKFVLDNLTWEMLAIRFEAAYRGVSET